ncbi:hypothetical protein Rhopal_006545-T1 [Rhodotorula paludigena]|uniref:Beta-lactamase-related domain-containing protein n=1 Tax=Rhodotorula paludigena TaxID=86838 RepID=A0AAV5GYA3_9BASI|nr:hypothetical protein Rhopal_006545-T1 [Rhodotorula paludigena]
MAARSDVPVLYSGHAGLATADKRIQEDSIFELFSCTKLVGSIAALQLVEQDRLALEDDASLYAEELRDLKVFTGFDEHGELVLEDKERPVTVQTLFTHTAGFPYIYDEPRGQAVAEKLGLGLAPYRLNATREWLTKMPLLHQPGAHFKYGTSVDWLTYIVEKISGLDLETYVQKNIFRPLGITDISFNDNPDQIDMAEANKSDPPQPHLLRRPIPYSKTLRYGGSGLKGSAPSYLRILRALLRGGALEDESSRILRPETVDIMFRPHLQNAQQVLDLRKEHYEGLEPFSAKAGEAPQDTSFGLGGALGGTGLASGRGARALHWSGLAARLFSLAYALHAHTHLFRRIQNTFWVIDRERDVCFLLFNNILPYGQGAMWDVWEKVEPELYKGLP